MLPLAALQGLAKAGLSDQDIEQFVIPQRTRRHRAEKKQPLKLLPAQMMVRYDAPNDLPVETVSYG